MAFTDHIIGPSSIRLRRSSTAGEVPSSAMLRPGELAVNTADGRIFIGSDDGVKSIGEDNQIVSSGGISSITDSQQEDIKTGTIVTTTDGRRWVYKGTGSKTQEASYVELADITPVWSVIADKPSTFTPSSHTHAISEVTGLQTALNGKAATSHLHDIGDINQLATTLNNKAPTSHTHAIGDVTGLQTSLNGKAASSHTHGISDVTDLQTALDDKITKPASANDGDVLTYEAATTSWIAAAPSGGGGSFDQSLNTTDAVTFLSVSMDNGSSLSEGSFDNSTGGANGISLNCAVGYELNWQGGRLRCTTDSGVSTSNVLSDSAFEFPGSGTDNMQIDSVGLTFPDATTQTNAAGIGKMPSSGFDYTTYGQLTTYGNKVWRNTSASTSSPDIGSGWDLMTPTVLAAYATPNNGDVFRWNSTSSEFELGQGLPVSASMGDTLTYNGSSWNAVSPSTASLPSGSNGQYLGHDGTNWVGTNFPSFISPPGSPNDGDVLTYSTSTSTWNAAAPSSGNPFDQSLNTTDAPSFASLNINDSLYFPNETLLGAPLILDNTTAAKPLAFGTSGQVLAVNATEDGVEWVNQSGGGGSTPQYVRISTAEVRTTPGGSPTSSGLSLVLQGSTKYIVEGLAYFNTETDGGSVEFGLQLSNTTSDGDLWLDIDNYLDLDPVEVKVTSFVSGQNVYSVLTGFPSGNMGNQYAVRFRALVEVGAISSTNVVGMFGVSSVDADVYLEVGSWMCATVVTT